MLQNIYMYIVCVCLACSTIDNKTSICIHVKHAHDKEMKTSVTIMNMYCLCRTCMSTPNKKRTSKKQLNIP